MLFAKYEELSLKGIIGQIFFWIRYALCAFPIASLIISVVWAIKTSSNNWSTIVNHTILILCIITMILSIASFVFILFAALSLFQKLEKIFTYIYFFITIVAFIISFVLLSFGNSSHEISYLSQFDKACGNSNDTPLTFPTPPPTPSPYATPAPSFTPSPSPAQTAAPTNVVANIQKSEKQQTLSKTLNNDNNYKIYNAVKLLDNTPTIQPTNSPIATPTITPQPTVPPKNFSESDFCLSHWTSWSRKRYIRERTIELKNAFAGIISPWVILFFIEFILMLALDPPKFISNLDSKKQNDEENELLDEHLLPDQESQHQANENNNTQLEVDSIFRDEDASGDENAQAGSNA